MQPLEHRNQQLAIRAAVLKSLTRLWRTVDAARLPETIGPFADAAAVAISDGFLRSSRTAGLYYIAARPAGITTVEIPALLPPIPELTAAKVRAAGLSGIVNGRRGGRTIDAALSNGFVKVAGTASSVVLAGGRDTVMEASRQDPAATGKWRRIAGPTACAFCQMLADRGPVYTDDTADFASHDHCGCAAEPEFI